MDQQLPTTSRCRMMQAGDTSRHSANLTGSAAMILFEAFATAEFPHLLSLPSLYTYSFEGEYVEVLLVTTLRLHQLFPDADRGFHGLHDEYEALLGKRYNLLVPSVQLPRRLVHQSSSPLQDAQVQEVSVRCLHREGAGCRVQHIPASANGDFLRAPEEPLQRDLSVSDDILDS